MKDKKQKIFFSGIAGSGMSAIAVFMSDKGNMIYGSDRAIDISGHHPLKKIFQTKGISIVPQDGNGIDDSFDLAVFSTAVEPDKPEVIKAKALGIPVKTRPEYLAEITESFKTIAVAGTSGKSTTSGMLAFLMLELGLNPNFIGGGRVKQFRSSLNPGNTITGDSDYLVIEACESDGTIINYRPSDSIILNLDLDHHSVSETSKMFKTLIKNTKGRIILNADDNNLRGITDRDSITFSINERSDVRAENINYRPFGSDFSVQGIRFSLAVPGRYNIYNALSSIAFLSVSGIKLKEIAGILHEFQGIDRRFDIHLNNDKNLVVDDYAHNPHKISSLMEAVKKVRNSVCYIFQPHGFGPTRLMKKEYIETFTENLRPTDHLIILPIYYAGGTASKDISSKDLADGIKANNRSAEVADRDNILGRIKRWNNYVVFGARDETLSDLAKKIADALSSGVCAR